MDTMDTFEMIEPLANQYALEMTLALLLAGAAMSQPNVLPGMHKALTDFVLDGVKNSSAIRPDIPAEFAGRFEVAFCATLDRLFSTAKNFK